MDFVAIFAIFCAIGLPVIAIIVLIMRLTSSTKKERMAMIEKGMIPPEESKSSPSRLRTLRAGMGAIGGGVGALISVLLIENIFSTSNELSQMLIVLGTIFLFFGIGFIIYYVISKDKMDTEE